MNKYIAAGIFLATPFLVNAQYEHRVSENPIGLQTGFTLKISYEYGIGSSDKTKLPNKNKGSLRLSANGGVSSNFLINELHPSLNVELLFYCGGLGSRFPGDTNKPFHLDVITALTMTAGLNNIHRGVNRGRLQYRLSPLYYFSNFTYPSLQNPYYYSFSFGTNFIVSTDRHRTPQRVGFLNFNFNKVQVSYYNDGGALLADLGLGDGRDRYYTGGGVISYHGRTYEKVNLVELSFDKFTGFSKYAFELSNALDLGFVNYKDPVQEFYNKGMYTLNVANITEGWCGFVKSYNWTEIDAQHFIHRGLFNAFHVVPYQGFIAPGGQFNFSRLQSNVR